MDKIIFTRNSQTGRLQNSAQVQIPQHVAATVGTFDGLHPGHKHLIQTLKECAKQEGIPSMVVTFDRPPVATVRPRHPYDKLNDSLEQVALIAKCNVDYLVILPFDIELANLTAKEFMTQILRDELHVSLLISGYDHQFGKRIPDAPAPNIEEIAKQEGIQCVRDTAAYDIYNNRYSSSAIRNKLREADIEGANQLLGYTYRITGTVINGDQIGRTFGYPTANISPLDAHKLVPPEGVYAAKAIVWPAETIIEQHLFDPFSEQEQQLPIINGMLYIGKRPTIGDNLKTSIEIHLFNYKQDLYDKIVSILFIKHIRHDMKFASHDLLIAQIQQDEKTVREILKC